MKTDPVHAEIALAEQLQNPGAREYLLKALDRVYARGRAGTLAPSRREALVILARIGHLSA